MLVWMVDLRMILDSYDFFVKNEHIQVERLGKYSLNRASGKHAYELCFFWVGERYAGQIHPKLNSEHFGERLIKFGLKFA